MENGNLGDNSTVFVILYDDFINPQSFNTMKSRVRSKMAVILESGGTAEANLPVVDQRIYLMYPHNTSSVNVEHVTEISTENGRSFEVSILCLLCRPFQLLSAVFDQ